MAVVVKALRRTKLKTRSSSYPSADAIHYPQIAATVRCATSPDGTCDREASVFICHVILMTYPFTWDSDDPVGRYFGAFLIAFQFVRDPGSPNLLSERMESTFALGSVLFSVSFSSLSIAMMSSRSKAAPSGSAIRPATLYGPD